MKNSYILISLLFGGLIFLMVLGYIGPVIFGPGGINFSGIASDMTASIGSGLMQMASRMLLPLIG